MKRQNKKKVSLEGKAAEVEVYTPEEYIKRKRVSKTIKNDSINKELEDKNAAVTTDIVNEKNDNPDDTKIAINKEELVEVISPQEYFKRRNKKYINSNEEKPEAKEASQVNKNSRAPAANPVVEEEKQYRQIIEATKHEELPGVEALERLIDIYNNRHER
ncbi:hypothetical protein F8154_09395 [Alkaliphilus pronyensis]|uniref:Uncharacterized protein n=1 Tax=Alkaliphilus pronyensis TaxID=1482732 RepID=A0A6I0F497_9FIRM|nr:hypothetical protein [Alkaliphilus pronyensis]KAB3534142.1 hypothetical protein F8154_09395 [Alkaliphilus pronyensis]